MLSFGRDTPIVGIGVTLETDLDLNIYVLDVDLEILYPINKLYSTKIYPLQRGHSDCILSFCIYSHRHC